MEECRVWTLKSMLVGTAAAGGGRVRGGWVREQVRTLLSHGQPQYLAPRSPNRYANLKKASLGHDRQQAQGERWGSSKDGSLSHNERMKNTKFDVGGNSVSTVEPQ